MVFDKNNIEKINLLSDKKIIVPKGYTEIAKAAFFCSQVREVVLPETLIKIGDYAFEDSLIEKIILPSALKEIGVQAFFACDEKEFKEITIFKSVEKIGRYAFANCRNLRINCEAQKKPDGWDNEWNPSNRPVVWNFKIRG